MHLFIHLPFQLNSHIEYCCFCVSARGKMIPSALEEQIRSAKSKVRRSILLEVLFSYRESVGRWLSQLCACVFRERFPSW